MGALPRQGSTPPPAPPAASKPAAATEKAAPAPSAGAGAAGSLFDKLPAPKLPEQAAALGALKDLLGKAPGALEGLLDGKEAPAGSALGRLQGLFAPKDVGGAAPPPAKPAADKPKVKAEPLYEDDDFSAPKVCVWARVCVCVVFVCGVCAPGPPCLSFFAALLSSHSSPSSPSPPARGPKGPRRACR